MEDKKLLNNEELEKVNGGGNHEFEFGKDNLAMEDKKELAQVSGGGDPVPYAKPRNGSHPVDGIGLEIPFE